MTDYWPLERIVRSAPPGETEERQSVEEEIRALQTLVPDVTEEFRSMFESAVATTLARTLPVTKAEALRTLIKGSASTSPYEVYSALESIFHEGSQTLIGGIREEFRVSVHLLLERVERGFEVDPIHPGEYLGRSAP